MAPDYERPLEDLLSDERTAHAAAKTFLRIADAWRLSPEQQHHLLGISSADPDHRKRDQFPVFDDSALLRLSHILRIYAGLQTIFGPQAADWIRRPNDAANFDGSSALEVMLRGDDGLSRVSSYVDAWVNGN